MVQWWQTRRFRMGVAAGVTALAAAVAVQSLTRPWLVERWLDGEREALRNDPDAVHAAQVRRWTRLGDEGLIALVDLLREEEPAIRQAARTALRNEWNSWRLADAEERDRRTLLALERCATHGDAIGPEESELLSEWATETLARRIAPSRSPRITLACQEALENAGPLKATLPPLDATLAVSEVVDATGRSQAIETLPAELVQPAAFRTEVQNASSGVRSAGLDVPMIR